MAEDDNGGAPLGDITVQILKDIRDELRGLRTDTNARFGEVNGRLDTLTSDMNRRFEVLTARVENIRDLAGEKWREDRDNIQKNTARIDKLEHEQRQSR